MFSVVGKKIKCVKSWIELFLEKICETGRGLIDWKEQNQPETSIYILKTLTRAFPHTLEVQIIRQKAFQALI
jgi:hypothetical protein